MPTCAPPIPTSCFYAEVRRVLRPGGVIAAWTYYSPVFGNDIDAIIERLAHDVLANYWDSRLHYVVDEFHDLPSRSSRSTRHLFGLR